MASQCSAGALGGQDHCLSETCTGATATESGSTGRPRSLLTPSSPSGYGQLSAPYLAADEVIVRLILHPSRRKPIEYLASFTAKVQKMSDDTANSPPPAFPPTTCLPWPLSALLSYAVSSSPPLRNRASSTLFRRSCCRSMWTYSYLCSPRSATDPSLMGSCRWPRKDQS